MTSMRWKSHHITNVLDTEQPAQEPINTKAKSRSVHMTVLPRLQDSREIFHFQTAILNLPDELVVVVLTDTAADNLSDSASAIDSRSFDINTKRIERIGWVSLHIETLCGKREMGQIDKGHIPFDCNHVDDLPLMALWNIVLVLVLCTALLIVLGDALFA